MADMYAVPGETLTAIADAIRLKRDSTTPMSVDDMPLEISLIEGGVIDTLTVEFDLLEDFTTQATTTLGGNNEVLSDFFAKHLGRRGSWQPGRTIYYTCETVCSSSRSTMQHFYYVASMSTPASNMLVRDSFSAIFVAPDGSLKRVGQLYCLRNEFTSNASYKNGIVANTVGRCNSDNSIIAAGHYTFKYNIIAVFTPSRD